MEENTIYPAEYIDSYTYKTNQNYHFKVIMRHDKATKKDGALRPLYIRRTLGAKVIFDSLQLKLLPGQWDEDKQQVKKNHPEYLELNKMILERLLQARSGMFKLDTKVLIDDPSFIQSDHTAAINAAVEKALAEERMKHQNLLHSYNAVLKKNAELERKLLKLSKEQEVETSPLFTEFADIYLKRLKNPGTHKANSSAVSMFRDFIKDNLPLHQITPMIIKAYEQHIADNNQSSTVHRKIKVIKAIFNEAERMDAIKTNPFKKYKMPAFKSAKMEILTDEQLATLENLQMKEGMTKWYHLQAYLFSCSCGLRISDVCSLTWKKVEGNRLDVVTHKTTTPLNFDLPPAAVRILDKLRKPDAKETDYVFPFLPNNKELTPKERMLETSRENALVNKNLHIFSEQLGLPFRLRFHSSRAYFATNSLKKGMSINILSKLLGHASVRQTEAYLRWDSASLSKEVSRIYG